MAIIYVSLQAEGDNDGSSWENAYNDLQDALEIAESGDEIWVAEGTYKPTESRNRNAAFILKESVDVYGGFAGNESSLEERNILDHETILSGNINDEDEVDDNSYSIVKASGLVGETRLDGFTITQGFSSNVDNTESNRYRNYGAGIFTEDSNLILSNLTLTENEAVFGGGIAAFGNDGQVSLVNNIFANNQAKRAGGGVITNFSEADIINNLFIDNEAEVTGGGLYVWRSEVDVVNNTFSGNFSEEQGSAITAENGSTLEVSNSIVWDNTSTEEGDQVYNKLVVENFEDSTVSVFNSLVENGFTGDNNIDANPQFIDPEEGDYRLEEDSPAVDVGENEAVTVEVDLDNNPRIFNETVDLGAYEFGLGIQEIIGTDGDDSLEGTSNNDLILGLEGRDTLTGGRGDDTLDGGPGNNFLSGGPGNDSLTGGAARDLLRGGLGDDTLDGGAANDILSGDGGNDVITGGEGSDRFDFNSPDEGIDTLVDFDNGNNLIGISVEGFGSDLETGSLSPDQFVLGPSASSSEHRFVYSRNFGNLFFDPDGSGEAQQVEIAFINNNVNLTADSFLLF